MSQPEARLQVRIVEALTRRGCGWAMKQRLSGRRGWPDIYAIMPCGHPMHLEVKVGKNKPTKLQLHTLRALKAAGATVGHVNSIELALEIMNGHLYGCSNGDELMLAMTRENAV